MFCRLGFISSCLVCHSDLSRGSFVLYHLFLISLSSHITFFSYHSFLVSLFSCITIVSFHRYLISQNGNVTSYLSLKASFIVNVNLFLCYVAPSGMFFGSCLRLHFCSPFWQRKEAACTNEGALPRRSLYKDCNCPLTFLSSHINTTTIPASHNSNHRQQ